MSLKLFVLVWYSLFSMPFIVGSYPPAPFFYLNIVTAPQQDSVPSSRFTDADLQQSNFFLSKHLQEICEYQRTGQIPYELMVATSIISNKPRAAKQQSSQALTITEYVPKDAVTFKPAQPSVAHSETMLKRLKQSESIMRIPRAPIIHDPCNPS